MTRLKLDDLADDKPVKLSVELPAKLHRDLLAYAVAVNGGDSKGAPSIERIVPAMIERFVAADREFAKVRKTIILGDDR